MNPADFPPGTQATRARRQSLEVTVEGFRRSVAHIGRTLGPDDDWSPVLLLESREELRLVVPLHDLFHESLGSLGKDLAAAVFPELVARADAWLAGFVATSWMVTGPKENVRIGADGTTLEEGIPPSEHPDRVEVVGLFVASADTEQFHTAEIVRRAGRPPALRPWLFVGGEEMSLGGRFGNALRVAFGREPFVPPQQEGAA
jgi:hypothetical protein